MAGFDATIDQSKLNIHLIDITQRKPHTENPNPTLQEQDLTREVKFRGGNSLHSVPSQNHTSFVSQILSYKHDTQQYLSFILIWCLGILVFTQQNLQSDVETSDFLSTMWTVLMVGISIRAEFFKRNIGLLQMLILYNLLAVHCRCIDWVTDSILLYVFVNVYFRLKHRDLQKKTFLGLGVISIICHALIQTLDAGFVMLDESFITVIAICYCFVDINSEKTELIIGSMSAVNA